MPFTAYSAGLMSLYLCAQLHSLNLPYYNMSSERFSSRHIGPRDSEISEMLKQTGSTSVEELISRTVPKNIRLQTELNLPAGISEYEYLQHLKKLSAKNTVFRTYIGQGYHNTIVPPVIQRNILENPGWYTAYTPYQAEISQGRLQALLNFQTMVMDLTGMEIANASLLDEATAAAEAMFMFHALRSRDQVKNGANQFFISENCHPQTIDVMRTRAVPAGIELIIGQHRNMQFSDKFFGALLQYPTTEGHVLNYADFVQRAHQSDVKVAVAADILSLALLTPPGEWDADAVVGNTQRFGVPMGYGGPHAAFFATREEYKRSIPGRIIGVSVDEDGKQALRMALQTREQHIRREKATSNICTAQALLAVMASMYAVYHGPEGIRGIAKTIADHTAKLAEKLNSLGFEVENEGFFDTLFVGLTGTATKISLRNRAEQKQINFRYFNTNHVGISLDETTTEKDIADIVEIFTAEAENSSASQNSKQLKGVPAELQRSSDYLAHPVFNTYRSETEMMRYIKILENRDLSLTHSMIPLGSCTMKLNAASELLPITWPEWANLHPYAPIAQAAGYQELFEELKRSLCEITGFDAFSLQPNSGAQGEYAGLMVIRDYHYSRGEGHRDIALIPASAHGTNPASAVMAGMKVVVVNCDENGNIDVADLKLKAEKHATNLSACMITYPSTHGVFEEAITEITKIIHDNGGQVYMDGANMNAQVGLTNPGFIGADVCHLNLHKTFAIPHGGGGPGMGPIGVKQHLSPFLPGHVQARTGGRNNPGAVSAAPWGSALILLISYGYIKMLGKEGLLKSTQMAILNANYIKSRLENHYPILYSGKNNTVAHEMIVDCRQFKSAGIEVTDIAKRLMDYGFHAPTVSFPVAGTLMIEPTESESKQELDRFCDAMISIRAEIEEILNEAVDKTDNVLKNSPHTMEMVAADEWPFSYSRQKAAFPLEYIREAKYWPPVRRVDNAAGDRNLICSCPDVKSYEQVAV